MNVGVELPRSSTAPLQLVLNSAARFVFGLRPRDHFTEALISLYWLPVPGHASHTLSDADAFWRHGFPRCRPPDLEQLAAGTATARH